MALVLVVSCGGGSELADDTGVSCTPGTIDNCACVGIGLGARVCLESGTGFGACECAGDAGTDIGAPDMGVADAFDSGVDSGFDAPDAAPVDSGTDLGSTEDAATECGDCDPGFFCQGDAFCALFTCQPAITCSETIISYCGCDGVTFTAPRLCPMRRIAHAGPC